MSIFEPASRPGDRSAMRGGKSGLHGNTVPGNARRGRPQGKCHRKQTAAHRAARVKGCGKSAPGPWQQGPHGKPHREQDRIGTMREATPSPVSGPVVRVGCTRRLATGVPDEWSPRRGPRSSALQNPAYRSAGKFHAAGSRKGGRRRRFLGGVTWVALPLSPFQTRLGNRILKPVAQSDRNAPEQGRSVPALCRRSGVALDHDPSQRVRTQPAIHASHAGAARGSSRCPSPA